MIGGALGAQPRDAGQRVVVADQREPLGDLGRRHEEALLHHLGRVARVLVGVVPPQPVGHELGEPLVDPDDDDVVAGVERGARVRRGHMDLAGRPDHADAERLEQMGQRRELGPQEVGPRRSRRLVDHRDRARRRLERQHPVDRARHREQRVDRLAARTPGQSARRGQPRPEFRGGDDERAVRHRGESIGPHATVARGLRRLRVVRLR